MTGIQREGQMVEVLYMHAAVKTTPEPQRERQSGRQALPYVCVKE